MKLVMNITKGYAFLIVASFLVIAGLVVVIAYNSSPANPAVFGHSLNEINVKFSTSVFAENTALGVRKDYTCPAGKRVVSCISIENPDGTELCNTGITESIVNGVTVSKCSYGGCDYAVRTQIICAGLEG